MAGEKQKICNVSDPEELRPFVTESGDFSCAKCCARSKDPANLCQPVTPSNVNLFCE